MLNIMLFATDHVFTQSTVAPLAGLSEKTPCNRRGQASSAPMFESLLEKDDDSRWGVLPGLVGGILVAFAGPSLAGSSISWLANL